MEAPQKEQPRGCVRAEPHTQVQGRLSMGWPLGCPAPVPGHHLYSFVPCFSQVVLEQSPPVFSYPICLANLGHQVMV